MGEIRPQNLTNNVWAYATLVMRGIPAGATRVVLLQTNSEDELSQWDPLLLDTAEDWVKRSIEERRRSGGTSNESAITTAMLWAFWELSSTPARILPLRN